MLLKLRASYSRLRRQAYLNRMNGCAAALRAHRGRAAHRSADAAASRSGRVPRAGGTDAQRHRRRGIRIDARKRLPRIPKTPSTPPSAAVASCQQISRRRRRRRLPTARRASPSRTSRAVTPSPRSQDRPCLPGSAPLRLGVKACRPSARVAWNR
eukprot:351824-Chlamydomonas_euryale.AAC.3